MKAFVFSSQENEGFLPAARAFKSYLRRIGYQVNDISFAVNVTIDSMERDSISSQLGETTGSFDLVAYFGHGGSHSLISADMTIAQFCNVFRNRINNGAKIILYACSTGTPGGFAEQISRRFAGSRVIGHTTAEDATRNPAVVVYPDLHTTPNQNYIVHPYSLLWPVWVRKLLESDGMMYWKEYPFQCIEDIALELYEYAWLNEASIGAEALAYLEEERSNDRRASGLGRRYAQITSRALSSLGTFHEFVPHRGESVRAQRTRREQEQEAGRVFLAESRFGATSHLHSIMVSWGRTPPVEDILQLMRIQQSIQT